jgi:hypothetical protein
VTSFVIQRSPSVTGCADCMRILVDPYWQHRWIGMLEKEPGALIRPSAEVVRLITSAEQQFSRTFGKLAHCPAVRHQLLQSVRCAPLPQTTCHHDAALVDLESYANLRLHHWCRIRNHKLRDYRREARKKARKPGAQLTGSACVRRR